MLMDDDELTRVRLDLLGELDAVESDLDVEERWLSYQRGIIQRQLARVKIVLLERRRKRCAEGLMAATEAILDDDSDENWDRLKEAREEAWRAERDAAEGRMP